MNFQPPTAKKIFATLFEIAVGLAVFCLFLWLGSLLKTSLRLILPANVIGMLLLLVAIAAKIVPLRWIEPAGRLLLLFMPLLFVPIYAGAGAYKAIWIEWGWLLVPVLLFSVIAMWIFTGHLSQSLNRILRK